MSLPIATKAWTISPNNRITYVTLSGVTQGYLYAIKEFLKTNGYTIKGSASGGTGAMDAVDRWASAASVTPRATTAGASQAWVVLIDANGCNILLTYQGATDDVARVSFSATGVFIAAGTPQNQPTATDEQVVWSVNSIIGSAPTADRMLFCWVSSDRKMCRFAVARANLWVGAVWGVETITPTVTTSALEPFSPTVFTPPVWGFGYSAIVVNNITTGATVGSARVVVASVASNLAVKFGLEEFANGIAMHGVKASLFGGAGYPAFPMSIGSIATEFGKLGNLSDWWLARTTNIGDGDTYLSKFIALHEGVIWPWDGVTVPLLY